MKKHTVKNQRKKVVPICYRKSNLSRSNNSLSQLLSIGQYKKRANELAKNNRFLARALQEARCETAYKTDIIRNYANDHNQIMFARLKLQGMTKTISQLVNDLHEVVTCLDLNWAMDNDLLQKNGYHHGRLKIKEPTVNCIEEVSVQSSESADSVENNLSCPNATSDQLASDEASMEEIISETCPSTSEKGTMDNIDIPPILFVDDPNDKVQEKLSREHKSSRRSTLINQASLTPELDIDLCILPKRNSSRKQVIIPSRRNSSRSSRKVSSHQSEENGTPKTSSISATNRKLSSVFMLCEESLENKKSDSIPVKVKLSEKIDSLPSDLHFNQDSGKKEFPESVFVNMKERGSKNAKSFSPDLQTSTVANYNVNLNNPSNALHSECSALPSSAHPINNESDHTVLLCEDMELTEVIHLQQMNSQKPHTIIGCPISHSDLPLSATGKKVEINVGTEKLCSKDKLISVSENLIKTSVFENCGHLDNMQKDNYDSAINDVEIHPNAEKLQPVETCNKKCSASPTRRSSRSKNVKYRVFFSSDESESDASPVKLGSSAEKTNKAHRGTIIFKHKPSKTISDKSPVKNVQENKSLGNPLSVYDLDVSNSKKSLKKSRSQSKTKKTPRNKEISKPLSENLNVTKLQGTNYKFTKKENLVNKEKEHQNSIVQEANLAICIDETTKNKSHLPSNHTELKTGEATQTVTQIVNQLFNDITSKNHELSFKSPKSEARRVSFASTDLVCNFNKASVSKQIADNKKTFRASKSAFELKETYKQPSSEIKDSVQFEANQPLGGILNISDNVFNSSEETELYTFIPPSQTHQSSAELLSPKKPFSVPPPIGDSYDQNPKVFKSTSKQKLGKLSLKGNRNCENTPPVTTSDKSGKNILFDNDSQSSDLLSKCKTSKKYLSNDNLSENTVCTNSQTVKCPLVETQTKTKNSRQIHVAPVEDNILISTDDIQCAKVVHKNNSSSVKKNVLHRSSDKTSKKSSTHKKIVDSSPVLKDVLNLEGGKRESTKRRSKVVSYKEIPLNKKMRR